jgi:hypothetical protein
MSLKKHIQFRKGFLCLSVFQTEDDGKILVSLDKDFVSRRIKGPLFTESEIGIVAELLQEYEQWSNAPSQTRLQTRNTPDSGWLESYYALAVRAEIDAAIHGAHTCSGPERDTEPRSAITVLPTLPKYRYVFSCIKCGCHVPSYLRLPGGHTLKLCPNCKHVDSATK